MRALRTWQRLPHLLVDLSLLFGLFWNQCVFFETDPGRFLMKVIDKHDQLLVQKAGILRLREDRLCHGRRHRSSVSFVFRFLQARLPDVIIDRDQVFQL